MKNWIMVGIALLTAAAISSCSEDTSTLGYSLVSDVDRFTTETDTFEVSTRSIASGAVLSRNAYSYLGRMKDPETGTYITNSLCWNQKLKICLRVARTLSA